jgi:hypothetical protein
MRQGIDCASPITNPAALKKAGKSFACRYLSTPGNAKNLTKGEADGLKRAGVGIVCVFETTADRALSGHAGGVLDAHAARTQASVCGMPAQRPVYFAVDFDATGHTKLVLDYLVGAATVLGRGNTGVYGGLAAVKAALDANVCRYAWQTYAWSGGKWDPRAHIQQYQNGVIVAGISADLDRATTTDFGQWPAPVRIVGYTVSYEDAHGDRRNAETKHPATWLLRHPKAKKRGLITVRRRLQR